MEEQKINIFPPSGTQAGGSRGIRKAWRRQGTPAVVLRFSRDEQHRWHSRDAQDILYKLQSSRCTLRQPRT